MWPLQQLAGYIHIMQWSIKHTNLIIDHVHKLFDEWEFNCNTNQTEIANFKTK